MDKRHSNQVLPSLPKKNFWSSSKKLATGSLLLFAANVLKNNEAWQDGVVRHFIYTLGSAALVGGLQNALNNAILWYSQKVTTAHTPAIAHPPKRKKSRRRHQAIPTNIQSKPNQQAEIYHRFQKYQCVLMSAFHCISMLVMLFRYTETWLSLPNDISAFSFSFPESMQDHSAGPIFGFFHMPLIIPTMIVFSVIGFFYNFKELYFNTISQYPRQGNSPAFGFLNAFSQIALSAALNRTLMPSNKFTFTIQPGQDLEEQLLLMQKALESHSTMPTLVYFISWLNMSAVFQTHQSAITLFFNAVVAFVSRPEINIETVDQEKSEKRRKEKRSQQNRLFQHPKTAGDDSKISYKKTTKDASASAPPVRRKKIKTRGVAGEGYTDESATSERIEALPSILYHQDDRQRPVKLDLINDLRRFSQIKERHIRKELSQLEKFLPNGKIINTTGSEHRLTWHWRDKTYHLKFETPHGKGATNVYKGRKLHKILNILETGYLWGWGRDNIHAYMAEHNSSRYLGRLTNILFRRPNFEEPDIPILGM